MSVKGQIFSLDFLVACSMFLIALTIIYIYWGYASLQIQETMLMNDMIDRLNLASQIWFKEGTPRYWDNSSVIELGMANDHSFNWTKMTLLGNDIKYGKALTLAGVGDYYLYYRVSNEANSTLFSFGEYPSDPKNVMKARRVGILNESIAIVEVIIWR
ncbi:MAG TPA: hypothetical protein VJ343_02235 [archaeon]|nr:hypothetical protein [archaeon]